MRKNLVLILGLCAGLATIASLGGPAFAQSRTQQQTLSETPILITADQMSHNRELGVITASGHVEISQGERILLADSVSYNERDNLMSATGNVSLVEPTGDVVFAEYMELTGDFRDGIIKGLRVRLADNARIAAAGGRRTDGNRTEMANAVYSPCNLCVENPERAPLWQLKARRIIHDKAEQTVEYRDAWMEMAGIPIAYTPYFSHPDPTVKRQSGFLAPSIGSSTYFGPSITTPYFWNIAPNQDLTITPTATVNERNILAGEYRYLGIRSRTDVTMSGTIDSHDDFRGHIDGSLRYHVNDTWRWGGTLQRATDDTYTRRYRFPTPSSQILTSNLYAEAFRGRDYASANAYAFQNLEATADPGQSPFVLPFLEYSHISEPNSFGARMSLNANALALTRSDGVDTRRTSVEVGYHIPYIAPYGNVFSIDATVRGDLYNFNDQPIPNMPGETDNGFQERLFPQLGLGWKLPLVRQSGQISQTLTPMVQFYTAPNGGNPWDIPNEDSLEPEFDELNLFMPSRFSGIDRVEGGTRVSYGGQWGVYGPTGAGADIFFGQSYRFTKDDAFAEGTGLDDHLSDYVGRVRILPTRYLTLAYRTRLDKDSFAPHRSEVSATVGPPAIFANVNYVFFDDSTSSQFGAREEIYGNLQAKIDRNWKAGFTARHDIEASDLRSVGLRLTYDCECFTFDTIIQRDFYEDRDLEPTNAIMFRISFKTLGDVTGSANLSEF